MHSRGMVIYKNKNSSLLSDFLICCNFLVAWQVGEVYYGLYNMVGNFKLVIKIEMILLMSRMYIALTGSVYSLV